MSAKTVGYEVLQVPYRVLFKTAGLRTFQCEKRESEELCPH
jgi:hypothetical protein